MSPRPCQKCNSERFRVTFEKKNEFEVIDIYNCLECGALIEEDTVGIWDEDEAELEHKPFTKMPEGDYNVTLTAIDSDETAKGSLFLALTMEVVDGEHKGRKLWSRIYCTEGAVGFNKSTISGLGLRDAIKKANPNATNELLAFLMDKLSGAVETTVFTAEIWKYNQADNGKEYPETKIKAIVGPLASYKPVTTKPAAPEMDTTEELPW